MADMPSLDAEFRDWWNSSYPNARPNPQTAAMCVAFARHVVELAASALVRWGSPVPHPMTASERLLERQYPQPIPVAERPWEREGWCDIEGECWMGDTGHGGFIPSWRKCRPEDAPNMSVSLPVDALPLPSGEVQ